MGIHDCAPHTPWAEPPPAWDINLWQSKPHFSADSSVKWELAWLWAEVILCIGKYNSMYLLE